MVEGFRNHISRIAFPTLLVLGIGSGAGSFLDSSISKSPPRLAENKSGSDFEKKAYDVPDGTGFVSNEYRDAYALPVAYHPEAGLDFPARDTSIAAPRDTTRQSAHPDTSVSKPAGRQAIQQASPDTTSRLPVGRSNLDSLSAHFRTDTTSLDSLKLSVWLSTIRRDHPQANTFESYHYPLFLYSNIIQHTATFDSSGEYAEVRQTLLGKDIRMPIDVPLDEYVKLEENQFIKRNWEDLAHAYTAKTSDQLGSLMAGMTNIDIPIPPNPVLSIFGPPRINLKISGAVDIHGAWRNQKTNTQTLSALGNVTNQPDFKQDVQINVDGTVGDKLAIGANWDTQNQFDYENQLHIKYTGYDDEIVKSVEAGNVSMSTNSSFIGSSQALFGIKSQMQFGPMTLTALASQQKAQGKTLTVSGGSQAQTFTLHAYEFAQNHFFLDTVYIHGTAPNTGYENHYTQPGQPFDRNLYVTEYEVWIQIPTQQPGNTDLRDGVAVMDLPPITNYSLYDSLRRALTITQVNGSIEAGKFIKLLSNQFSIDPQTGVLTLLTSVQPGQAVAVAYKRQDGDVFGTFTYLDSSSTKPQRLVLKLVKPGYPQPTFKEAWEMQLRNIYPTGGLNLTPTSLEKVQINYMAAGQTGQTTVPGNTLNLLQIFGVDKTGQGGTGGPDGNFDINSGIDIDLTSGEIIFPFLRPFDEAFRQGGALAIPGGDTLAYTSIYDTTLDAAQNDGVHDKFTITGQYTSSVSSHYTLGFNLVQGSVKVLLNSNTLTPDQDYTVDYITGDVNIKNQGALQPGANVQIQYETNDIFQIASKSLVGLRGDLKINDQTNLGLTLMNFSQQSPNDKVRLGEEPMSNTIMGADAGTTIDMPFVTKALDALPLIQTAAPSRLTLHGEAAYMLPNPNTRTSVIASDNGQGIAYIDDFEGAKRIISLPISYSSWTLASPPTASPLDSLFPGIPDSVKNDYRTWTYWYNVTPADVYAKDIWPQKNLPADQQFQTVMNVSIDDTVRGQYNRAVNLDTTMRKDRTLDWGGMMTLLSGNATNLTTQNINYIEIWMQINSAPGSGTMYIDLGQVSEDIIGDHVLHTEDATGQGTLQSGFDLGIDLQNDDQERKNYPWITDRPMITLPDGTITNDPEGDDYYFTLKSPPENSDFTHVNGTQGNSVNEAGKFPDTEDLNHNGQLDVANNYYRYAVRLDTTKNQFIAGGGSKGWYQYIIPLQDYQKIVGSPSLDLVQFIRVWFSGMTGPMKIRIAEMNFIGNYWRTPDQNDTTMQASVVNVFDNPGYTPPAPGLQPVDHSNPTQNVLLNEQSLSLVLNGLKDGDNRYVYKTFPQALDMFNYHTMKFFVHGDPKFNYIDSTNYDADVYVRFGGDSLNFYEYRQPVRKGWQDISIDFAKLTAKKQTRDTVTAVLAHSPAENGIAGSTYWLQGNPSLQSISYFQIGIENPRNSGTTSPLYGAVWIDELRLTDVDNTPGGAYRFDSNILLADVGSLSFNYSKTDPYFHSLTNQFGSRNTTSNWGISGSFSLERLLPREWVGTSIPFTYTHNENFSNPLYLPNSDILVSAAVAQRADYLVTQKGYSRSAAAAAADSLLVSSQALTVNDSWAIPGMKIAFPSSKWYVKDILDALTFGFNWNGSKYRDPQRKSGNSWAWNFNSGYSVSLDPLAYFTPFPSKTLNKGTPSSDFQIRYLPNTINFSMSASRSLTTEQYWVQSAERISPNFTAQRSGGINWRLTNNGLLNPTIDYRFNVGSSLLYADADTLNHPYRNSYVFRQIFLNNGLINFGQDNNFSESFSIATQPKLPFDMGKYFDLQSGYSSQYQWVYSPQQGALGRGAGVNSSLQLGTSVRLKMLSDSWFGGETAAAQQQPTQPTPQQPQQPQQPTRRGHGREEFSSVDTTTSTSGKSGGIGGILNVIIKEPFLNFDNISINFSSANSSQNGGLPSLRPGMGNFFKFPFIQESTPELGPSQLYQLGLISDPYGKLNLIRTKGFPFFGFDMTPGRRLHQNGISITDNFSNNNNVDLKTSRDLWKGARIDLSWHLAWTYTRNTVYATDSLGNLTPQSVMVTGQVTRSFLTIPPVLIFSSLKSGIGQVATIYRNLQADPTDTRTADQKLSQAFVQGFETLPILDKIFGSYMPRVNYAFHWDGLEQLPLFSNFASRVSIDHSYQSTYSQNWHSTSGTQVTDAQTLSYGFQPLLGLNIAYKIFGDASVTSSILYNTSTQFNLSPSAQTIAQSNTSQLTITADYSKRGMSIPLFGLNLQNDIDISVSISSSLTNRSSYNSDNIGSGGTPIDGTNQTTIEIRFKYAISQRVTAAVFYTNTKTTPTVPASPIPGTTTNEAGVDVHVSIAG